MKGTIPYMLKFCWGDQVTWETYNYVVNCSKQLTENLMKLYAVIDLWFNEAIWCNRSMVYIPNRFHVRTVIDLAWYSSARVICLLAWRCITACVCNCLTYQKGMWSYIVWTLMALMNYVEMSVQWCFIAVLLVVLHGGVVQITINLANGLTGT